jgi:hypothetical protein
MQLDSLWFWWKYEVRALLRTGLWERLAWRLPRRLVYFAVIRAWAAACPGDQHPDSVRATDVAGHWQ